MVTLLQETRALQQPERFNRFLSVCSLLWPEGAETTRDFIRRSIGIIQGISVADLQNSGFSGKDLGVELRRRREDAVRELLS